MKRSLENIAYQEDTEALAKFAKALAHPTRIAILKHLENQSCCFTGDLVDVFPLAQSTISQHLKELKNAQDCLVLFYLLKSQFAADCVKFLVCVA